MIIQSFVGQIMEFIFPFKPNGKSVKDFMTDMISSGCCKENRLTKSKNGNKTKKKKRLFQTS